MKKLTQQNQHLFFSSNKHRPANGEIFSYSRAFDSTDVRSMAREAGFKVLTNSTGGAFEARMKGPLDYVPFRETVIVHKPLGLRLFLQHIASLGGIPRWSPKGHQSFVQRLSYRF